MINWLLAGYLSMIEFPRLTLRLCWTALLWTAFDITVPACEIGGTSIGDNSREYALDNFDQKLFLTAGKQRRNA